MIQTSTTRVTPKEQCVISNSNSLCTVFDRFVGQVETMRLPAPAGVRKP